MNLLWSWAWIIVGIVVFMLLFAAEVLDWVGRFEIIEKRWPRSWKIINNRPARLLLLLLVLLALYKDVSERLKAPALAVTMPAPAAPTVTFLTYSIPASMALKATPKRQVPGASTIEGDVNPVGNCNVIQTGGVGNSANPNCGPQEPSIKGIESIPSDPPSDGRGHPRTTIKFFLDANPISQKFFAKCDRACVAERAEPYPMPSATSSSDYANFSSPGDPKFAGWQLNTHLEANEYVSVTVVSLDDKPVKIVNLTQKVTIAK